MNSARLKAIIFDFDGVICESVEVKTNAFRKLFADYPKQLDKIIEYHTKNGGVSRYEKFKVIYKDIIKEELTQKKFDELCQQFSKCVYQLVVEAPLVRGAEEFLTKYYNHLMFFIVSGTPQDEMISIIREKGLGKYFRNIYGSPRRKDQLIKLILAENNLEKEKTIFVGDSMTDYQGAKEAGIKFIGRIRSADFNFFDFNLEEKIEDLVDLDAWVEKFYLRQA